MVRWVVVVLATLEAGWMLFDGTRALLVDDYVGQTVGPWRHLVEPLGIKPESTLMKSIFVAYGAAWLAATAAYARRSARAESAMLVAAAGSLWYLVVGTVLSAVQLALLALSRRRRRA